jgi:hypothetical protein
MSWKEKAIGLYKRFGAPAKFSAKMIVGSLPYGSLAVDLVGQVLDCVHETVKDQIELDEAKLASASPADLKRVEEILGLLAGDLAGVMAKVAAWEHQPEAAAQVLELVLATDDRSKAALHKLDHLARGIEGLHAKADLMNAKLDELLRRKGVSRGSQPRQHLSVLANVDLRPIQPQASGMQTALSEDREAFLRVVQDYTSVAVRETFARVLDDLVHWTKGQDGAFRFRPRGNRDQATVAFCLTAENTTFWTAYPRKKDGAKLCVLDSLSPRVPEEVREMLRREFARIENPVAGTPYTCPTLSFMTLEAVEVRNEVKQLLSNALASLRKTRG